MDGMGPSVDGRIPEGNVTYISLELVVLMAHVQLVIYHYSLLRQ